MAEWGIENQPGVDVAYVEADGGREGCVEVISNTWHEFNVYLGSGTPLS